MSSGKCKLRQHCDTTTYLLEWAKSRHWQHQMLVRLWSSRTHSLLAGMQSGAAILGGSLVVSYQTKHALTIRFSNDAAWIFLKNLKTYVHTKTCIWMFIAALFIIAQSWKQPRYSSGGEWINKLWYIKTLEYFSGLKKKWAIKPWKDMEELSRHISKWKKPVWNICMLYDSNYITFFSGKIMEMVKRSVVASVWGWEGKRQIRWSTEDF